MRGLGRTIIILGLACIMPLLGCDEDGSSPTGPDGDTGGTVTIECLLIGSNGIISGTDPTIGIRLTNTQLDTSFYHYPSYPLSIAGETQKYPEFVFSGIPPGTYEVTPFNDEQFQQDVFSPLSVTVVATEPYVLTEPIFSFWHSEYQDYVENEWCLIAGHITCDTDVTCTDISVYIEPESGTGEVATTMEDGDFVVRNLPRGTYTITPIHNLFTFEPPSMSVHGDEMGVFTRFKATYTGRTPHTISGRFVETNGNEFIGSVQISKDTGSRRFFPILSWPVEASGSFSSPKLPPGAYVVTVLCHPLEGGGSYNAGSRDFTVLLGDNDIDLGDINFTYNGALYYHVSGVVRDADGAGMEGVTIVVEGVPGIESYEQDRLRGESDSDGAYKIGEWIGFRTREDLNLTVTPERDGWTFTPPSAEVTYIYREHVSYENLAVPEFIGVPAP
jgi:hypothetical protein